MREVAVVSDFWGILFDALLNEINGYKYLGKEVVLFNLVN